RFSRDWSSDVCSSDLGVKIKVGGATMGVDVERVRAAREAVDTGTALMLDANGAYHAHEAIAFANRVADFDIAWFEEPVMPDNYRSEERRVGEDCRWRA